MEESTCRNCTSNQNHRKSRLHRSPARLGRLGRGHCLQQRHRQPPLRRNLRLMNPSPIPTSLRRKDREKREGSAASARRRHRKGRSSGSRQKRALAAGKTSRQTKTPDTIAATADLTPAHVGSTSKHARHQSKTKTCFSSRPHCQGVKCERLRWRSFVICGRSPTCDLSFQFGWSARDCLGAWACFGPRRSARCSSWPARCCRWPPPDSNAARAC
jgi:hypothetical protein